MSYTEPDICNSALVTIDVQRDFSLPGAPAEIAGATNVVPNMVRLLNAYRKTGNPIIHIIRLYRTDGSGVDLCRRELIRNGTSIVRQGSEKAGLVKVPSA
ncbi:MAG: isochorismatase family protein [Chlorobiales bacterium]|nr:isochorismatase family protein [Chlorobiales bacterium]